MTTNGLNHGTALNVNIPAVQADKISGVEITRQSVGRFKESFERRVDPRGNIYYWLSGERPIEEYISDADAIILKENKISITPIHYDLTNYDELQRLKSYPRPEYRLQPK